jgi:hypothetical protein
MNAEALTLMVIVQLTVTTVCAYFFWRVLTAPHRPEPDSYAENDDEE